MSARLGVGPSAMNSLSGRVGEGLSPRGCEAGSAEVEEIKRAESGDPNVRMGDEEAIKPEPFRPIGRFGPDEKGAFETVKEESYNRRVSFSLALFLHDVEM